MLMVSQRSSFTPYVHGSAVPKEYELPPETRRRSHERKASKAEERQAAPIILAAVLFVGLSLFMVARQAQILHMTLQIEQMRKDIQTASDQQAALKMDASRLSSTARIEEIAARLGLRRPTPDQVLTVTSTSGR